VARLLHCRTDHLTGFLNRRAFFENAHALCALQAEHNEPVAIL
jgi:GGDEF domain-containing protein